MKQKVYGILAICLGALLFVGLVANVAGKTSPAVIAVVAVPQPVAELKPGTYQVTFEYTASEMVTFWHTNSYDFEWRDWDKSTWTTGHFFFTTHEPVTLYVEGFGCANVCGKVRALVVTSATE